MTLDDDSARLLILSVYLSQLPCPSISLALAYHSAIMSYPAHASPVFPPVNSSRPQNTQRSMSHMSTMSDYDLEHHDTAPSETSSAVKSVPEPISAAPPLISPSMTPDPANSSTNPAAHDDAEVHDAEPAAPPVLEELPEVNCEVRARIPTTAGQEMFLHLYHNSADNKEHLAIVFGPHIRSRSLDAPREGETEKDRMIRGAYVGKLYPGRTSSRLDQIKQDAGVSAAPVSRSPTPEAVTTEERQDKAVKVAEAQNMPPPLAPMVRIHSECYTGETVWSARCDCGEQLDEAARLMSLPFDPTDASIPSLGGVIIYLRQEGRGIGLLSKLKAYNLQDLGHDTMQANLLLRHPADARSYGLATAMLMDLGLGGDRGIRLLTNNPEKVRAVEGPGREVVVKERVPMIPLAWSSGGKEGVQGPELEKYIGTKVSNFFNSVPECLMTDFFCLD
jgi:GTP cyclohydrolase II